MTGPDAGWVFLIGRGRDLGYRLLMAPDFLVRDGESDALFGVVQNEDETARPQVAVLNEPESGALCVVFHVRRVTESDLAGPAVDGSGRPLLVVFGFVARGTAVTDLDEHDVNLAWEAARTVYRRFHRDELAFTGVPTASFPLRSTITPPPEPVPAPVHEPARRSRALVGALVVVILVVMVMVWRGHQVTVPDLRGRTVAEAQADLREAGLRAVVTRRPGCADHLVHHQDPEAGARVGTKSVVTLTVCGG